MDWGIIYWQQEPNYDFSLQDISLMKHPDDLSNVPIPNEPFEIIGFVDSAHANSLKNRRSTTGYGFMLRGGVIACRCSTQSIVATSSTEAEFIAAVAAAKVAIYLRSIMHQLGYQQNHPTTLYEDNSSAIQMVNAKKPTNRSRHIDIRFFAIQMWKERGFLVLKHIPGIINPSDAMTKALGWVLHSRHSRRLMGHYGPPTDYPG